MDPFLFGETYPYCPNCGCDKCLLMRLWVNLDESNVYGGGFRELEDLLRGVFDRLDSSYFTTPRPETSRSVSSRRRGQPHCGRPIRRSHSLTYQSSGNCEHFQPVSDPFAHIRYYEHLRQIFAPSSQEEQYGNYNYSLHSSSEFSYHNATLPRQIPLVLDPSPRFSPSHRSPIRSGMMSFNSSPRLRFRRLLAQQYLYSHRREWYNRRIAEMSQRRPNPNSPPFVETYRNTYSDGRRRATCRVISRDRESNNAPNQLQSNSASQEHRSFNQRRPERPSQDFRRNWISPPFRTQHTSQLSPYPNNSGFYNPYYYTQSAHYGQYWNQQVPQNFHPYNNQFYLPYCSIHILIPELHITALDGRYDVLVGHPMSCTTFLHPGFQNYFSHGHGWNDPYPYSGWFPYSQTQFEYNMTRWDPADRYYGSFTHRESTSNIWQASLTYSNGNGATSFSPPVTQSKIENKGKYPKKSENNNSTKEKNDRKRNKTDENKQADSSQAKIGKTNKLTSSNSTFEASKEKPPDKTSQESINRYTIMEEKIEFKKPENRGNQQDLKGKNEEKEDKSATKQTNGPKFTIRKGKYF